MFQGKDIGQMHTAVKVLHSLFADFVKATFPAPDFACVLTKD